MQFVQQMLIIGQDFVEELLIRFTEQLFEWGQIGWTVAAALAAVEERVDSLSVGRRDETGPSTGCIQ